MDSLSSDNNTGLYYLDGAIYSIIDPSNATDVLLEEAGVIGVVGGMAKKDNCCGT